MVEKEIKTAKKRSSILRAGAPKNLVENFDEIFYIKFACGFDYHATEGSYHSSGRRVIIRRSR